MRVVLEFVERIVVVLAAIAAMFPLYQWYDEREDRRFDRAANLAISGKACEEWILHNLDLSSDSNPTEDKLEHLSRIQKERYAKNMTILCWEIQTELSSDEFIADYLQLVEPLQVLKDDLQGVFSNSSKSPD